MERRSLLAGLASAFALALVTPLATPAEAQRWQPPEGSRPFLGQFRRGIAQRQMRGRMENPRWRMMRRRRMMMMRQRNRWKQPW